MGLWATQFFGLVFFTIAVAFLSFSVGYQMRKDEERHERKRRSGIL